MSGHRAKSQLSPFYTPRKTSKQECAAVSQVLDKDNAPESFRVTQSCASGALIALPDGGIVSRAQLCSPVGISLRSGDPKIWGSGRMRICCLDLFTVSWDPATVLVFDLEA